MLKRIAQPVLARTVRLVGFAAAMSTAATAVFIFGSAPASAQQGALCGKRDQVISQLQTVHGESRQSVGLQRDARVMETYANRDTGSWTIIVSMPSGMACLVAAGEAFQGETDKKMAKDDPA